MLRPRNVHSMRRYGFAQVRSILAVWAFRVCTGFLHSHTAENMAVEFSLTAQRVQAM